MEHGLHRWGYIEWSFCSPPLSPFFTDKIIWMQAFSYSGMVKWPIKITSCFVMLFVCCDLWEIFIILQLSSLSMCKDTVALGPLPAMVMQDFFIFWQVFRTVKFLKVWHHYFEGTMLGWWCSYLWILFVYIVTSLKS